MGHFSTVRFRISSTFLVPSISCCGIYRSPFMSESVSQSVPKNCKILEISYINILQLSDFSPQKIKNMAIPIPKTFPKNLTICEDIATHSKLSAKHFKLVLIHLKSPTICYKSPSITPTSYLAINQFTV